MSTSNTPPATLRGADLIVHALANAGVRRIFALSGNQIMPLFDACLDAGIEIVHTRHEAACVYMAEAHAQLTGELGVAMVTAGAGLGNAVGPLFCAAESNTPVLLLSGDSPLDRDGNGAFQEMPQVAMTAPLTRYSARPDSLAALVTALAEACAVASGPYPGPVHLALPADLLESCSDTETVPELQIKQQPESTPDISRIQSALESANQAVILLGPALNATRCPGLPAQLASATGAAVAVLESPRGLRDPVFNDLKTALAHADTVVLLGKRCDFTVAFGAAADPGCNWIAVSSDDTDIALAKRNLGVAATVVQHDPLAVAHALAALPPREVSTWQRRCSAWLAPKVFDSPPDNTDNILHPLAVCRAVQTAINASDNPILIVDGGEFGQWAQAVCHAPRRVVNGVAGSIGGGIPQAIAASLADPTADVFVLMGDGSAGFHIAELDTAVRSGAQFRLIIGNDKRWNAEHQIQLRNYGPDRRIGCQLADADYAAIATACGATGHKVTGLAQLNDALDSGDKNVRCIDVAMQSVAAPG